MRNRKMKIEKGYREGKQIEDIKSINELMKNMNSNIDNSQIKMKIKLKKVKKGAQF